MPPKKMPPKRPPTKTVRTTAQQMQFLNQNQAHLLRMQEQQANMRRVNEIRSFIKFLIGMIGLSLVYYQYTVSATLACATLLFTSGMFDFLKIILAKLQHSSYQVTYNEALRRADIMMKPITDKDTATGGNESLSYGFSCMQGWRRSMEDAHTMELASDGAFFAVYDGHSGSYTAEFCGKEMHDFVKKTEAFKKGDVTQALYDGFIAIDQHLHKQVSPPRSGCTAVVLYISGERLYCANAGDSRCLLCRNGEAFPLSTDHKPYLPSEESRIERAGGYVIQRRVNGILALSRAIGDFSFKSNKQVSWDQQAVTSAPEVRAEPLNRDKDEFAVIACDGIWDVMTNEQVIEFVRPRIQNRVDLGKICEELMESCLSPTPFGLGCDNMSVIIVKFERTRGDGAALSGAREPSNESSRPSEGRASPSGSSPRSDSFGEAKRVSPSPPGSTIPPVVSEVSLKPMENNEGGSVQEGKAKETVKDQLGEAVQEEESVDESKEERGLNSSCENKEEESVPVNSNEMNSSEKE